MFNYSDTYKQLPSRFYSKGKIAKFKNLQTIVFNSQLLNELTDSDYEDLNSLLVNKSNLNISQVYSGHQFGHFSSRLGDGRAMLLCEIIDKKNNLRDLHLKGSGRTIYSRGGDGLSALGPVIREHILCESMHALGVPSTRALASLSTSDFVQRESELPGGVFVRVASSHIRFGTFEYFASQGDLDGLKLLADYTINRHFKHLSDSSTKYIDFIHEVIRKNSQMIAKWMSLGFIHGVMNTDNMLVSGETIDYGPCAFMDTYSHDKVFSSIDRNKRYAYNNQLNIGIWNIYRFASALIPLIDESEDKAIGILKSELSNIESIYNQAHIVEMNKKLGLKDQSDLNLINRLLNEMEVKQEDFTVIFKNLTYDHKKLESYEFYNDWISESPDFELMKKSNPCFIPRNHQVEKAIKLAYLDDFSHFKFMLKSINNPYVNNQELEKTPQEHEIVQRTFCGT